MPPRPEFLYLDGEIVPYDQARVHVLTAAFKYSATVFEGIRAYWNDADEELFIFRMRDHLQRLAESTKIARIPLRTSIDELEDAIVDLIRRNGLREDLHIRVLAFVAEDNGGIASTGPAGLAIAAMPQGRPPELEAGQDGVHVGISHFHRLTDAAMSPRIKATANYMNSRLALLHARESGYDDAVLLDASGKVTEGPGYNFFMVRKGQVITPPVTQGILEGVTRDTLIQLFRRRHGIEVVERAIDKTELYIAEEAFFCGSSKEVTPVASVDRLPLGSGAPGPVTRMIRDTYFSVAYGQCEGFDHWLQPVYRSAGSNSAGR